MASNCLSQSYSAGYNKYVQGDFEGAEKSFQVTLNKRLTTAEKARIYKMLGITQYMQGKRIAAEASFQTAKGLNPFMNISPSEVLDESVVTFFNTIEAPKGPKFPSTGTQNNAQGTFLKVYANPSYSQVAVDGVNLGRAGGLIKVKPGFHNIEISAKGYKTHSQPIDVKENQVNNISINLAKVTDTSIAKPPAVKQAEPPAVKKDRKVKVKKVKKRRVAKPKQPKKIRKKRRRPVKATTRPTGMKFAHYLPFGVGQFINGDTSLGLTFSALQVLGFGYGSYLWFFSATSHQQKANDDIVNMERLRDEEFPDFESDAWYQRNEEITAYSDQKNQELDAIYNQSLILNLLAGTVWATSIIHSYIKVKKARTPPGLGYNSYDRERQARFFKQRSYIVKPSLSLDVKPNWGSNYSNSHDYLGLLVDLKLEF